MTQGWDHKLEKEPTVKNGIENFLDRTASSEPWGQEGVHEFEHLKARPV